MIIQVSDWVYPKAGPKSLARMGRRIAALFIDWLIAYGLAALAMAFGLFTMPMLSTAVLVIWFVLGAASVRLFGFTRRPVRTRAGRRPRRQQPSRRARAAHWCAES